MKLLSIITSFALVLLLTCCGEVAEGMTSEDAKTGAAILMDAMEEGAAQEAAGNPEPNMTLVPDGFNTAEICTYLDGATLANLSGCMGSAEKKNDDASDKTSRNYKYIRYGSCMVMCKNDQGLPVGGYAALTVIYNGKKGGALEDYELEQYKAVENLAGTDGVYYPKNGDIVIAVKGNYRMKFNAFVDNKMKPEEIGKAKVSAVLASVAGRLPQ